jgi:GNAT superfamily N-acetyltransferase
MERKFMGIRIRRADGSDLGSVIPLLDAYRVFYEKASDLAGAEKYLSDRFALGDAVILLAFRDEDSEDGRPIGFTLLLPTWSSVAMGRIFTLSDLYVVEEGRKSGAGRALLEAAHEYARGEGAVRVSLRTAVDNETAQRLYRSIGYQRNDAFLAFDFHL